MSEDSPEYDYIEYRLIRFPSDKLDIAAMRRAHPDLFDVENASFEEVLTTLPEDNDGPLIGSMLRLERMLAQNAYEEVRGVFTEGNVISNEEKPGFIDELTGYYVKYGLATGRQHAQQMIRDFEAQATSQARTRGPGCP
ncbi:MAG TPA: hypothetical protein VK395_28590 [Gemmataceae bacterium]|nr:hypothetical protein [Gemmataceae bacterium]